MEVVSGDDIRESGAINIADYLKRYGFQVTQERGPNYGDETIRIRGLANSAYGNDVNSDILILVDGRRNGTDTVSFQNMNMIDRIEIIRGPGAVQYGASAMGGVVNFITKRGTEELQVRAEAGGGSDGMYKTNASVSGMVKKFEYALGATYSHSGDYTDGSGKRWLYTGYDYKMHNAAIFGYNINDYNHLNFSAFYSKQKNLGGGGASTTSYTQWQDKKLNSYDLVYEGSNEAEDKSWLVRYFFGDTSYTLKRDPSKALPTPRPGSLYIGSYTENNFKGSQAHIRWEPGIFSFTLGGDYLDYEFTQFQAQSTTAAATNGESDIKNYGAFLIAKAYLLEDRNLVLQAGFRYDFYSIEVDNLKAPFTNSGGVTVPASRTISNRDFRNFLPAFGIAYSPYDFIKLRANYGKAFKLPSPRQLAGNYFMVSTPYYGDINLEPESSETWDVGFDLDWAGTAYVSASYFNTFYENFISTRRVTPDDIAPDGSHYPQAGAQYFNNRKVRMHGLELDTRFNIGRFFDLPFDLIPYFNATRMFNFKSEDGKYVPLIAKNSFGTGIDFHSTDWDLQFSLDGTYYGVNLVAANFNTGAAPERQGGVMVWDFSLSKGIYDFSDQSSLDLKIAINNLFNKYYDTSDGDYMSGRTFYVGLVYHLN
jgi:vitamin B12 transporter